MLYKIRVSQISISDFTFTTLFNKTAVFSIYVKNTFCSNFSYYYNFIKFILLVQLFQFYTSLHSICGEVYKLHATKGIHKNC